jgi:hypothetical protein
MQVYRLRGASALALILAAVACSDNLSAPLSTFYANLTGDQALPVVTTTATGSAHIANTGTTPPAVNAVFTGLSGVPTRISIAVGLGGTNGPIRADLCGGTVAACASATALGATGAPVAATMVGGFAAADLYTAMKTEGNTYLVVFTVAHPAVASGANTSGGEIRGAINFTPLP